MTTSSYRSTTDKAFDSASDLMLGVDEVVTHMRAAIQGGVMADVSTPVKAGIAVMMDRLNELSEDYYVALLDYEKWKEQAKKPVTLSLPAAGVKK